MPRPDFAFAASRLLFITYSNFRTATRVKLRLLERRLKSRCTANICIKRKQNMPSLICEAGEISPAPFAYSQALRIETKLTKIKLAPIKTSAAQTQ